MTYGELKTFGLLFLSFFTVGLISLFLYHLNFDISNISVVSKILFFDKFLLEYILTAILFMIFMNKYKVSQLIALISIILYLSISTSQLITYLISGEFLSKLALENVEFIGYIYNWLWNFK